MEKWKCKKNECVSLPDQKMKESMLGKSYSRFLSNGMMLVRDTTG